MPTYDYKCKNCNHLFEEFQSMTAETLIECPSCRTPNLVRIIGTGAGMIFKGSGFYHTDYKNSGSSDKTASSPGSSDAKAEEKSVPKPEVKAADAAPTEKKSDPPPQKREDK